MCYKELPEQYGEIDKIDLQKNKKQFWAVQIISVILGIALFAVGWQICDPIPLITEDPIKTALACGVLFVGMIAYIVLHELTHGIFLWLFTKVKPKFGFVGWAAYCGNTAYCDKPRYLVVALAPVVVWGIIFGVLNVFFHSDIWFWCIWLLQIVNVSGAAGDLFVSVKMLSYPKDILVQDTGLAMTVYGVRQQETEVKND